VLSKASGKSYWNGGICNVSANLTGKNIIITGGNTGIGYETARTLAIMGGNVVIACRDENRGSRAVQNLRSETNSEKIEYLPLDLSSLSSVREFVELYKSKHEKLNILVNNAGVMRTPLSPRTQDGFEMQIGVNHLGHFYLSNLLMPTLISTARSEGQSRVVNVASLAHSRGKIDLDDLNWEKRKFDTGDAYSQSKLANILFSNELNRRVGKLGVVSTSLHPGVIRTELGRYMMENPITKIFIYGMFPLFWYFTKNATQGAQTSIYCSVAPDVVPGEYYSDCKVKQPISAATDPVLALKLWELSEQLVNQKFSFQ